jgi:hypothetical protein
MKWLESELGRSRLPKSSLAGYLGLDNAAVTRLLRGDRLLTTDETLLAGGFFSVVPDSASNQFLDAVERLRSTKLRESIALEFVRWFAARSAGNRAFTSFLALLAPFEARRTVLRADQIVAICRVLNFDLPALTDGFGVRQDPSRGIYEEASKFEDAGRILTEAASRWAGQARGVMQYEFGRGATVPDPTTKVSIPSPALLRASHDHSEEFLSCAGFLVADENAKPLFQIGQTIYIAESEPRKGDAVAVIIDDSSDGEPLAIIGLLEYRSRDVVVLDLPSGRRELKVSDNMKVRRIAFCRY